MSNKLLFNQKHKNSAKSTISTHQVSISQQVSMKQEIQSPSHTPDTTSLYIYHDKGKKPTETRVAKEAKN